MINAKQVSYEFRLDIIMISTMIFLPLLKNLFGSNNILNNIDEIIILWMIVTIILKSKMILNSNKIMLALVVTFFFYNLILIFYHHLPVKNIAQAVISMKCVIIFYYFFIKKEEYKLFLLKIITKIFVLTIILTSILAIFELLLIPNEYSTFFSVYRDGRGFNGVFLTSYFSSRSMFASYILIIIPLLLTLRTKNSIKTIFVFFKNYYLLVIILILFIILSSSRKEFAAALLLVSISLIKHKKRSIRVLLSIMSLVLLVISYYVFLLQYGDVNNATLGNEEYVRYKIFAYSLEIFNYYFPFGSGPGTYGSVLSRDYIEIYNKFDVPEAITGYDGKLGPIYDLYISSLLAEYGVGILFYPLFIYLIYRQPSNDNLNLYYNTKKLTLFYSIILFILVFVTPVFTNLIGFIIFALFGLFHKRKNYE